jgi:hypothetical protein
VAAEFEALTGRQDGRGEAGAWAEARPLDAALVSRIADVDRACPRLTLGRLSMQTAIVSAAGAFLVAHTIASCRFAQCFRAAPDA